MEAATECHRGGEGVRGRDESAQPPPRVSDAALLACFLAVVAAGLVAWARVVHGNTPLIRDELAYLWQAEVLSTGRLTAPAPARPEFVDIPPIAVHEGRRFARYPIGYPLLLAPWMRVGAPWALNVALAVAALALLHRFARRIDGRGVAWIAVALTALSPFFIIQSTVFLSHALTLLLSLVLLVALSEREARGASPRWAAVAGAAVGYAHDVSPFVAAALALVVGDRWLLRRSAPRVSRREWAHFAAPAACGAILFATINAATTGSPWTPAYFLDSYVRAGFGPSVGLGGYGPADAIRNTIDRIASLNRTLFAWPGSSLLFAGPYAVAACARRAAGGSGALAAPRDSWDRSLAVLFVGLLAIYALWYHAGTAEGMGPRFLYPAIPAVVLFTARGMVGSARLLASLLARLRPRSASAPAARDAAAGFVVAGFVAALFALGTVRFLTALPAGEKPRERRAVRALLRELEARGVDAGTIFVRSRSEAHGPALLYASRFDENAPLLFAWDLREMKNGWLLRRRPPGPVWFATFEERSVTWTLEPAEGRD